MRPRRNGSEQHQHQEHDQNGDHVCLLWLKLAKRWPRRSLLVTLPPLQTLRELQRQSLRRVVVDVLDTDEAGNRGRADAASLTEGAAIERPLECDRRSGVELAGVEEQRHRRRAGVDGEVDRPRSPNVHVFTDFGAVQQDDPRLYLDGLNSLGLSRYLREDAATITNELRP